MQSIPTIIILSSHNIRDRRLVGSDGVGADVRGGGNAGSGD